MTMATRSHTVNLALLANRLSLGVYFAIAGYGKVFKMGMDEWMQVFGKSTPSWLPTWFATPYGYALPFVEMLVGAVLILGLYGRDDGGRDGADARQLHCRRHRLRPRKTSIPPQCNFVDTRPFAGRGRAGADEH